MLKRQVSLISPNVTTGNQWPWTAYPYLPSRSVLVLHPPLFKLCQELKQTLGLKDPPASFACLQPWSGATQPNPSCYIPATFWVLINTIAFWVWINTIAFLVWINKIAFLVWINIIAFLVWINKITWIWINKITFLVWINKITLWVWININAFWVWFSGIHFSHIRHAAYKAFLLYPC